MLIDERNISKKFCHYLAPSYQQCSIEINFLPKDFDNAEKGDETTTIIFEKSLLEYLEQLPDKICACGKVYACVQLLSSENGPIGFPYREIKLVRQF